MHRNVDAADEMLAQLGDLLRLSLERKSLHEAPLREELSVLEPYLNILRIRFGDRLSIRRGRRSRAARRHCPALHPPAAGGERHPAMASIAARAQAASTSAPERRRTPSRSASPTTAQGFPRTDSAKASACRTSGCGSSQLYASRGAIGLKGNPESGTEVVVRIPREGNK